MFRECIETLPQETRLQILQKVGYTVGPATARVLSAVGFGDVRGGDDAGNGAKLVSVLMRDFPLAKECGRIVFLTGEIRRDVVPKALVGAGYALSERVIYRTSECEDVASRFDEVVKVVEGGGGEKGWVVFFSPQGTGSIVEKLKEERVGGCGRWKIASIGPTTEEYLLKNGLAPDVIAKKPDPDSLYEEMVRFDSKLGK